jgi:hypothetical protein
LINSYHVFLGFLLLYYSECVIYILPFKLLVEI